MVHWSCCQWAAWASSWNIRSLFCAKSNTCTSLPSSTCFTANWNCLHCQVATNRCKAISCNISRWSLKSCFKEPSIFTRPIFLFLSLKTGIHLHQETFFWLSCFSNSFLTSFTPQDLQFRLTHSIWGCWSNGQRDWFIAMNLSIVRFKPAAAIALLESSKFAHFWHTHCRTGVFSSSFTFLGRNFANVLKPTSLFGFSFLNSPYADFKLRFKNRLLTPLFSSGSWMLMVGCI